MTTPDTKGILCPACGRPGNRVRYTRLQTDGRVRLRECIRCGYQWRTEEHTLPSETIVRAGKNVRSVHLSEFIEQR